MLEIVKRVIIWGSDVMSYSNFNYCFDFQWMSNVKLDKLFRQSMEIYSNEHDLFRWLANTIVGCWVEDDKLNKQCNWGLNELVNGLH